MMTETQRAALMAAEGAFRRYTHHHITKNDGEKAKANYALADMMAAALSEPEPADTPTGWLYTSAKSLRKKYIAHRAGLPEALLDLDPVALYSRPQR